MVMAPDEGQYERPDTPEQKYHALLKQYDDAFEAYAEAFREAQLPEDRQKVIREKYPRPDKWASQFLELAEQNPNEPFDEEALISLPPARHPRPQGHRRRAGHAD